MTIPSSITIVGASLAGMHAARAARAAGFAGSLTIIGDETHQPYDRPPLSKQVLAGDWDTDRVALNVEDDLDATWMLGRRATALSVDDRTLTLDDCEALRADLDAGPRRVVVIGAGFIGAEVAATCRGRDLEVTMLEALPVPLVRGLGEDMGRVMADLHREHGVDLRLSTGVEGIDGTDRVEQVRLSDGSAIEADVVLVGIGVVPTTAWLEDSGLTIDNGVVCDDTCLAAPGITVAGDIARWPSRRWGSLLRVEHWENAIQQGEHAGRRLMQTDAEAAADPFDPVPWFWSDQYDRKIQMAGVSAPHDRVEVVIGSTDERRFVALYANAGTVTAVLGMNRPRHVMQLRPQVEARTPFDEAVAAAQALA